MIDSTGYQAAIKKVEKNIEFEKARLNKLREDYQDYRNAKLCTDFCTDSLDAMGTAKGIIKEAERENFLTSSTRKLYQECHEIIVKKNHDYAGAENEWKNFETVKRIHVSVQKGIFIRFLDKVTRLENLLFASDKPYVTDESIDDTIKDAINYLGILYARRQMELNEQGGGKNYNYTEPYPLDQMNSEF